MSNNTSDHWTNTIYRAAATLLLAAVMVFVTWQLIKTFVPALVIIVALLLVYRSAVGVWRRRW